MFLCCIIPQYNSLEIYTTDIFSCPALLVTIFVLWRLLQMDYYLYLNTNIISSWIYKLWNQMSFTSLSSRWMTGYISFNWCSKITGHFQVWSTNNAQSFDRLVFEIFEGLEGFVMDMRVWLSYGNPGRFSILILGSTQDNRHLHLHLR